MQTISGNNTKIENSLPFVPWEPIFLEMLKDPAEARAYLKAAFADGDPEYIHIALNKIAKANLL